MTIIVTALIVGFILGSGATYLLQNLKKIDLSKPHNDFD